MLGIMGSLRVMRLAAGRGGVSVRPTLPPLSGPRALSYTPLPHRSPDGFVSKVYSTPEEALHDFTDGVKVPRQLALLCKPSLSSLLCIHRY